MLRKSWLPVLYLLFLYPVLMAQPVSDDLPIITNCVALVNAKVITMPGKAPQVAHVIIRDGLITQIGPNVNIPPDAYRIAADSLYAYPAFIDAFSSTAIKEQEETTGAQGGNRGGNRIPVDAEGNPSLEDAGITPYKSARSTIDAKEKSISDWRAQGFAIAHTVPKGKMIPGKGAILVLTGKDPDQLIWKEDVSMYAQWVGAGGPYPSTVIAVMAKWRELYENASNHVTHLAAYNSGSLVTRPNYNQAHEALMPVVKKEMPVYFRAPKVKDISRALALQSDLGMKMIVADAEEAWYLKDRFKSGNIPLILSLDLPDDKSEAKKEAEEKKEKPTSVPAPDSTKTIEGEKPVVMDSMKTADIKKSTIDPEKEAFEFKRNESLKAHRAQAATLAREGISFSFGTMSVKPADFSKNIQLMIDAGLTKDQALTALTTTPSKLLGVQKYCGTLEAGKMANVIVSTKPLFEKEAAIRFMIVEGNLYEYEVKEKKKKTEKDSTGKVEKQPVEALSGTWNYTIDTPDQKREGTLEFTTEDGEIKGIITGDDFTSGNSTLNSVVLDGNSVSFTFAFELEGQPLTLEFDLTLKGESFDGSVSVGEFGSFPISGQRTNKPE